MQQQSRSAGDWKTIQDVCTALSLPQGLYEAIRRIVKVASDHGQDWMRKDPDSQCWLVNTEHLSYHLLTRVLTEDHETDQLNSLDLIPFASPETQPHLPSRREPERLPFDVLTDWPQLCDWLSERNVSVSFNVLSIDEANWQWQWGDMRGNGCSNAEEAILSAIAARIAYLEHCATCQVRPDEPARRKWFCFF